MSQIKINDTTLRDGEQTAGIVFSNPEKIRIAKMLDDVGVDQIEAGIPIMGGYEKEAVTEICKLGLKASVMGWNRAVIKDIECSLECGVDAVAISISTSDIQIEHKLRSTRSKVLASIIKATEFAKKNGVYVSVSAEDASRADFDFLCEFGQAIKSAGADRLRFCDTVGILDPFTTFTQVKKLIDTVGIEVEMHAHDDFSMATANSLAGIQAGAKWVSVTVLGIGERAGNAALEEVIMALKCLKNIDLNFKTASFRELAEYVSKAANRDLPAWKSIVGSNVFAHESGIHVDGALKDPKTYEPFRPEEVGLTRTIVIGKHSGSHSIKAKFSEYGFDLSDQDSEEMLAHVKKAAVELKRPLLDQELFFIYETKIKSGIDAVAGAKVIA